MSLWRLCGVFLRIGAAAFGGLGATLILLERELVVRSHALTKADITESLTYTKLLPGSTVVQVVAYLAWRLGGLAASVLASVCFLLPSTVLMLILAYGYAHVEGVPWAMPVRRGILAAVVALLLVTMQRLAKPVLTTPMTIGIAVAAFGVVAGLHVSAVWAVVGAGLFGILTSRRNSNA